MPTGQIFISRKRRGKLTLKKVDRKVQKIKNSIEIKESAKDVQLSDFASIDREFLINGLVRGNGNGARVGEKITMKHLKVSFRLKQINQLILSTNSTSATWTTQPLTSLVRVIIFLNRQNNLSNTFAIGEILQNAGSQAQKMQSQYDYKFVDSKNQKLKYKILYDKVFQLIQGQNRSDIVVKVKRALGQKVSFTSSNNGDGTDIVNNKLAILFIPENNTCQFAYTSLLYYTDA